MVAEPTLSRLLHVHTPSLVDSGVGTQKSKPLRTIVVLLHSTVHGDAIASVFGGASSPPSVSLAMHGSVVGAMVGSHPVGSSSYTSVAWCMAMRCIVPSRVPTSPDQAPAWLCGGPDYNNLHLSCGFTSHGGGTVHGETASRGAMRPQCSLPTSESLLRMQERNSE